MAGAKALIQAAALHRQAAATVSAAAGVLDLHTPTTVDPAEQRQLADALRAAAERLVPGWLGAPLHGPVPEAWTGEPDPPSGRPAGAAVPRFVRVGTARPLDDAEFPAVVPLLGTGHLALDADARQPAVAGLLRSLLLRLLAAAPAGSLLVRAVDGGGAVFAPFAALADAGLMSPPAADRVGLRAVLSEAEQWVRPLRPGGGRQLRRDRTLLVVVASLPELADGAELARIAALAQQGPEANLHLIVAGWPQTGAAGTTAAGTPAAGATAAGGTGVGAPASPGGGGAQGPLPRSTVVSVREPYALLGDPPGGSYSAPGGPAGGLNAPVWLDPDPPAQLVHDVCQELATRSSVSSRVTLADLLPEDSGFWTDPAVDGLTTTVGHDGDTAVTLRFNDLHPHWLVGGRSGAGKTAFLVNVLYGLAARYSPAELALYLLDFKEGVSFTEFVPTARDGSWLPHARAVGVESDRAYGLAVLRELDAEMTRRSVAYKRAGVTRFADLRAAAAEEGRPPLPRILCVIDEFQVLLAGADPTAGEAVALLESLARKGRSYGIHLVLASQTVLGVEALYTKRDSIFGQFPVRVALPGGGDVLEPTNDAAAGLPLGSAVVNTAGGLGGPRGAKRGHEQMIRFPDPHADRAALNALRHRLWRARDPDAAPPRVFAGYAEQHLADDPTYRAVLTGRPGRPGALLGRTIDVGLSTAAFPLDASPGRHLAILGPSPVGAEVLDAAARSVAAHHPPGTARFVIASLVAEGDDPASALAAELAERHEVAAVDAAELADALTLDRPGYLVVFGMDAVALPVDRLRRVLREGPAAGVHLLSWWRGLRRFGEETGGSAGREDVAGLVFLNVPAPEVSLLLGRQVDWQPRPNRVLLHDRHADRTTVVVPFVRPERPA